MIRRLLIWAVALLLLCSAAAFAEDTELLFRALACVDKTGDAADFAARIGAICQVELKENSGVYTGEIAFGKTVFDMTVKACEGAGVLLLMEGQTSASRWSTLGGVAKKFDHTMRTLFLDPVVDVLHAKRGDKPAPRITAGSLNLEKIGKSRGEFETIYRNRRKTVFGSLSGWRSPKECAFQLALQFGGAVPEAIAEAEEEQEREELRQIEEESEGLEDDEDFGDDLEELWEEEPEEDEDFDDEVFEEVLGEEFEE